MRMLKIQTLLPKFGLDVSKPGEYLERGASPRHQNISIDRSVVRKRCGATDKGSSMSEEVMHIEELLVNSTRYLVRIGLAKVQLWNAGTTTWDDIGPSANSFVVTTSNNKLNFNIGAAELTATIAPGTYTMGASQADAGSLCKAVYDAIHAAEAAGTYTVTHNGQKVTITRSTGTFQILWKTGINGLDNAHDHIGTLLGFTDSADDTGGLTYTSETIVYYPLTGSSAEVFSSATPILSGERILTFAQLSNAIRKYTGTGNTADLGGSPPRTKFMQEYGPYLVLAHVYSSGNYYRMRVQWNDTTSIETWTGGNAGATDLLEGGDDITGLSLFGNYVCVHKESAIYLGQLVASSAVFQFDRRNTGVGTICNRTIQNVNENLQIFLARDGIRLFNGISTELISSPMSDEIRESMNAAYMHKCDSVIVPELNEYWVSVPIGSQTGAETVYKYNYVTGICHKDIRSSLSCFGKYQKTTQTTIDALGGTIDSLTHRFDDVTLATQHPTVIMGYTTGYTTERDNNVNNDSGVAINTFIETEDFDATDLGGTDPGRLVRWLEMQVIAKGNTLAVEYSTDAGATWASAGTITLDSDYPADDAPLYVYFDVLSSKIRFRFSNAVAGETFWIKDFVVGGQVREMRR